jgi:hypothetical protein
MRGVHFRSVLAKSNGAFVKGGQSYAGTGNAAPCVVGIGVAKWLIPVEIARQRQLRDAARGTRAKAAGSIGEVGDEVRTWERMSFHDREYLVYAVFGHPTASPPWVERTWTPIFEALDPIIQMARESAAVRSTQLSPGPGSPNQRGISFGRIGWNKQGCKKWTHSENGDLVSGGRAIFLTCEVWAPSWSICQREGLAPDVYFAVSGATGDSPTPNSGLTFNSHCVMAVASDLGRSDEARRSAEAIATAVHAVLRAHCVRPWGVSVGGGFAYRNAINDLAMVGLFKPGPRHQVPVSLLSLAGTWASF